MSHPLFEESLLCRGNESLRRLAAAVANAGMEAAEPAAALRRLMRREGANLSVGDRCYDLDAYRSVWLVGAGKASAALAQAVEENLGDRLSGGVVVVPYTGAAWKLEVAELLEAEHPVPGAASFTAGRTLLDLADKVTPDDLVISAVTGGSSALVSVPAPGITPEEKRLLHTLLLRSGADIEQVNIVRKHTSAIKGGRLAQRMSPAAIINVSVSDVAGDSPQYICDLTVQNTSRAQDAIDVLRRYDLLDAVPTSVKELLLADPQAQLPSLAHIDISTYMVVTGKIVCDAMLAETKRLGVPGIAIGTGLSGTAEGLGSVLGGIAAECHRWNTPFSPPVVLVACGGESTVRLADRATFGTGGPNQEAALAAAIQLRGGKPVAFLSIDTDGSDGGTTACGGLVDGTTWNRAAVTGVDLVAALRNHESLSALREVGDLIVSGPTNTNVNDLVVVAIAGDLLPKPDLETVGDDQG